MVPCNQEFCVEVNGGPLTGCTANDSCPYLQIYEDGSSTAGFFIKDLVLYDRVSGDLQTTSANGSIIFGWAYGYTSFGSEPVDMDFVWKYDHDFLVYSCNVIFGMLTKLFCVTYSWYVRRYKGNTSWCRFLFFYYHFFHT